MISPFKCTSKKKKKWFKPIFGPINVCLFSTSSWILVPLWSHWLGWTVFLPLQPLFSKAGKIQEARVEQWYAVLCYRATPQVSHEMSPLTIPCCGISLKLPSYFHLFWQRREQRGVGVGNSAWCFSGGEIFSSLLTSRLQRCQGRT